MSRSGNHETPRLRVVKPDETLERNSVSPKWNKRITNDTYRMGKGILGAPFRYHVFTARRVGGVTLATVAATLSVGAVKLGHDYKNRLPVTAPKSVPEHTAKPYVKGFILPNAISETVLDAVKALESLGKLTPVQRRVMELDAYDTKPFHAHADEGVDALGEAADAGFYYDASAGGAYPESEKLSRDAMTIIIGRKTAADGGIVVKGKTYDLPVVPSEQPNHLLRSYPKLPQLG